MELGKKQVLKVAEENNSGWFLEDEEKVRCFLPKVLGPENLSLEDDIEVFVYQDEGFLKATTETPYAEVGQYAVMECIQTLDIGSFLDWGMIKDLFVPYKQQKGKMEEGKRYLVYIYVDDETGLLTGTAKFKRNQSYENPTVSQGDKVSLTLMNESELGWNVIINQQYQGLLYYSDVYKKLYPLSTEVGYIKNIREDGKIDVTLQPEGYHNIDVYMQKILDALDDNYGLLYVTDKSSPEEIKEELQMSKKNFKKAIGGLYKSKIIDIKEDKIVKL